MSDDVARIAKVETEIEGHKELCDDRWGQLRKSIDQLGARLGKLEWAMAGMFVMIAAYLASFLLGKVQL